MKKSNLIVFVFILFLGGTVSTSLWLYVNIENQVDIPKEKKKRKKVSLFNDTIVHEI